MFQQEHARADAYGLIAQLFSAPPDASFLRLYSRSAEAAQPGASGASFTLQEPELQGYEAALRNFQSVCARCDADGVAREYDQLFRPGTGAIALAGATRSVDQMAALREHLASCGVAAVGSEFAITSYVAGTCEVMRWLIQHEKAPELQISFFNDFVCTGLSAVCESLQQSSSAHFYAEVASLSAALIESEQTAFAAADTGRS